MIVEWDFHSEWDHKGHRFGDCMTRRDIEVMYVNIPKNASSWTKPNLMDFGWELYNFHQQPELAKRHALVVLRDPVDRWVSGIAEYFALYHADTVDQQWTPAMFDLIFDRVVFDDHTEHQVKFLQGLDTARCTFMWFDETYRSKFSRFIGDITGLPNRYHRYEYQHVSDAEPVRKKIKDRVREEMQRNSRRIDTIKNYYERDYNLINLVTFYDPR